MSWEERGGLSSQSHGQLQLFGCSRAGRKLPLPPEALWATGTPSWETVRKATSGAVHAGTAIVPKHPAYSK